MLTSSAIAVSIALAAAAVAVIGYRRLRSPSDTPDATPAAGPADHVDASGAAAHSTEATQAVFDECLKLAFGVPRFDYNIIGDHAAVLDRVHASADESVHQ